MQKVFAEVGQSLQQVGGECPAGWIEMSEQRTNPTDIADANGNWVSVITKYGNCTPAQGLVALFIVKNITENDIISAINNIVNPLDKYLCQIGYTRATEWERNSESFQNIARLLQLTEEDIDNLFEIAVTIKV